MIKTIKLTGIIITLVLLIDCIGFCFWILSNQTPIDGFYIGRITAEVLRFVISLI